VAGAALPPDPTTVIRDKRFLGLLALAAVVGVVASLAAWGFLELVHYIQDWVFTDIPQGLGFDEAPQWWSLGPLALAGVLVAFAITRLPGRGGHIPAKGLNTRRPEPIEMPGILLAATAGLGLGVVLGPEAPLIALGAGLGVFTIRSLPRDTPPQAEQVLAAAGMFAAIAMIFGSPVIGAVLLIEAAGLSRAQMPVVLLPGLLASGIGSLVSIGMGSWTGLSNSDFALEALQLPQFARPDIADFGWTILLGAAVGVAAVAIFELARRLLPVMSKRQFVVLPVAGLGIAGLAIGFSEAADKGVDQVLFSGQEQLPDLVAGTDSWSLSALALLIAFKGVAYGISLAGFRGGPIFPAIFLGAAGGLMAAQLPGYSITPAVAVGIGAAVAATLKLPLSGVVIAILLTAGVGEGVAPLVIVGVVVSYIVSVALGRRPEPEPAPAPQPPPAAPAQIEPAGGAIR
jgi:H+/Cl- antiporter ClcA